jgi:hypothetical protein
MRTRIWVSLGWPLLVLLSLFFLGCASVRGKKLATDPSSPLAKIVISPSGAPSQVYFATYETVWRSMKLAVRYPIAMDNMDEGILVTDWIREVDGYRPPHETSGGRPGVRYRLQLQAIRGRVGGRASVKVTIDKQIQRVADFFSTPTPLPSDKIEEKVLLYRIGRELAIEEGLAALPQS